MKRIGWTTGRTGKIGKIGKASSALAAALLVILAMAHPARSVAQAAGASVHGHVINPAGMALNKGEVRLSTDRASEAKDRKYQYKFPIEPNGDYKGSGIAPGNYIVFVFQDDKSLDYNDSVVFANGDDKVVNFKTGNYDAAITAMQQATAAKPDEGILWITLGDAQLGAADAAAKAAKAAGTSSDPAVAQKYNDAAASYKKGVDLNAASKKPSPEAAAAGYNQLGQAYAKMGNAKDSADAYEMAAKAMPAQAAMYYFNEAATLYNAGKLPEAEAAADKAIAADPKKADAYYIKGQALIPQATVDPKTNKIVAPPGCVEAYQTYLELAPDGPHAADVKGVLEGIGAQVKSSYKAPKK